MRILSIDTSCDETAAAVTEGTRVLSNIIWSQASLHAKYGGIYPSLAKRAHEERIDWVINKALGTRHKALVGIDEVAVTVGPGLAIALEVGIKKAKELAKKYRKPFLTVNHVEGHVLSPLARPKNSPSTNYKLPATKSFPALAFVASGGTTQLILVKEIGKYEIIAETHDDALGEALDKAARMLGLGYPGGAILEKFAKEGNPNSYSLPIPLKGQENRMIFSYSGLKTAFYKLVEQTTKDKGLSKEVIQDLAASYQNVAYEHIIRVISYFIHNSSFKIHEFWFSGGVSANIELRKKLRKICKENKIILRTPYSKKLCTDNAAMIGFAAHFKALKKEYVKDIDKVERVARLEIDKS